MKIVETDNFGRDYPNEKFFTDYILPERTAKDIVYILNRDLGGNSASRYYMVVENDYKLKPGFEP